MAEPGENKQLLAALFGTMEREVRDGRVLGPTPWVLQLARDLEEYGMITQQWGMLRGALTQQVQDIGGTVLLRPEWRARYRWINHDAVKHMDTRDRHEKERGAQDEEMCGVVGENGAMCQYTGTKRAVAVHRATTHGQRNAVRELIRVNECPLCRKVFAGVKSTGGHVIRSMKATECRTKPSTKKQAVREQFHGMKCTKCDE